LKILKKVLVKNNSSKIEKNSGRLVRQILQKLRVVLVKKALVEEALVEKALVEKALVKKALVERALVERALVRKVLVTGKFFKS